MAHSDQEAYHALSAPFSQLSTPRERRLALEGLITSLSHQEIRGVKECVDTIHYQKDIFGELPLELSQRIAEYIRLPTSIRARRVSKKWLKILGSSQTSQRLLQPWHEIADSIPRAAEGLSPRAVSSLKAESIHAYCTGTAFDRSTFRASLPQSGSISDHVAYSSGRIAWIDKRTSITHLLALEDSGACLTNESDDDVLSHIGLSGSMMAVTTLSGQCRVTDFTTRSEHRFQLGLTNVQSMVVANGTVAVLHRPSNDLLQAGVTTWTLHDRTPVEFSAGLHRSLDQTLGLCDLKIMLDTSETRVIMFERVTEARLVHFTRFGLDGQVQAGGTLELPDMEGFAKHSEESTLNHADEWATVWSYSKLLGESKNYFKHVVKEVIRVQCHPNREFLRLKKDSYEDSKKSYPMSNIFFLNDIAYSQGNIGNGLTLLCVMDFSTSHYGIAPMGTGTGEPDCGALSEPERDQFRNGGGLTQSIFLGDQKFLICVCQHGFFVWVFDKEHSMPNIDAGYRKTREEEKEDRRARGLWRSWASSVNRGFTD